MIDNLSCLSKPIVYWFPDLRAQLSHVHATRRDVGEEFGGVMGPHELGWVTGSKG